MRRELHLSTLQPGVEKHPRSVRKTLTGGQASKVLGLWLLGERQLPQGLYYPSIEVSVDPGTGSCTKICVVLTHKDAR